MLLDTNNIKHTFDSLDVIYPEEKPGSQIRELLKSDFATGSEIRKVFDKIDTILTKLGLKHRNISSDSGRFHRDNLEQIWQFFQPHQYVIQ